MDAVLEQHSRWANERKYVLIQWIVCHARALIAILEGRFAEAEAHAEQGLDMGRRSHGDQAEGVYGMQMFTIRREQGRLAEVAPIIKRLIDDNPSEPFWRPGFALVALELGFDDASARILAEVAESGFSFPRDAKRSTTLAYLAEICAGLGDKPRAEELYEILKPYRHMTITAGVASVCYGAAGRFLGQLAAVLDAWDEAEQHFESALELDRSMGAAPWVAHTQYQFARMLTRRGRTSDLRRADALSGEAWATAEALGMVSLIDKLRRMRH
jgi:tetratricopeptide (TPR) repeat protein